MELSTSVGLTLAMQRSAAAGPVPPAALGLLPDLTLLTGVALAPAALSTDFTGPVLTFTLAPSSAALPAGLSLSTAGVLSGTPSAEIAAQNIVVRAANNYGTADSGFSLTVQDMLLTFDALLTGLTNNPTYGATAEDGVTLSADASNFSASTPGVITYQWKTVESGVITGAIAQNHSPNAALYDGEALYCTLTPDGYPPKDTSASVIRYAPPAASGNPGEQFWDVGTGAEIIDMSVHASGAALAWSVTGQGASINAATGLLSVRTDSQAIGAVGTVTATNSGGAVAIVFTFHIEDIAAGPGPDLSQPILDDLTDTIGLIVDEDCTIYWRRDPSATNPDPGDVIAGGGHDSGSFAVTAGANSADITFATGNDGLQEISFVAAVTPSELSIVQTVAIEIDTTDPVLLSSLPLPGANNAATTTTPTLTFDEAMDTTAGSLSLVVVGRAVVETFDLATGTGDAGGGLAWSAGDTVLTATPGAALAGTTQYAIRWSGLSDGDGNALADNTGDTQLSFTTGADYAQRLVDTNGTAKLTSPAFGGNEGAMTFSLWLRPDGVSGTQDIFLTTGRSRIGLVVANLSVLLKDTGNAVCYSGISMGALFAAGQLRHLYVAADFAADTLDIEIDGQPVAMDSDPAAFASASGAVDFDRSTTFFADGATATSAVVADLAVFNAIVPNAVLWNGGTPPDPDGFATAPRILLGGLMTADARGGDPAQGWNDGHNQGAGGAMTVVSATFTDVI